MVSGRWVQLGWAGVRCLNRGRGRAVGQVQGGWARAGQLRQGQRHFGQGQGNSGGGKGTLGKGRATQAGAKAIWARAGQLRQGQRQFGQAEDKRHSE